MIITGKFIERLSMPKPTQNRQAWYLFEIGSTLRQARKRIADRKDVTVTQAQASALFGVRRFEGITQSELADFLDIKPITLCRVLDGLESMDCIERRADLKDRRKKRLYLAPKSNEKIQHIIKTMAAIEAELLTGLTVDEEQELKRLLAKASNANQNKAFDLNIPVSE